MIIHSKLQPGDQKKSQEERCVDANSRQAPSGKGCQTLDIN